MGEDGLSEPTRGADYQFPEFAEIFTRTQKESREKVAENWPDFLNDLKVANTYTIATLGSVLSRLGAKHFEEISLDQQRRATVHAATIQGISAIEMCISNGLYAQAAALVRQEIEGVEFLRGVRQGKQKDGATPRLKAYRHLGRIYSQLTSLAHYSKHDFLNHLMAGPKPSLDPVFNPEFAKFLFGIHIHVLAGVVLDIAEIASDANDAYLTEKEEYHFSIATGILIKKGVFAFNEGGP